MHVGHGFAKIDAIISRFGACGARVAHRSPADVVAQTKGGAAVTTLACLNRNLQLARVILWHSPFDGETPMLLPRGDLPPHVFLPRPR